MSSYVLVNGQFYNSDEICHWGVKGQKWGVRRYQNKDGSLTDLGKKRLSDYKEREVRKIDKKYDVTRDVNKFNRASERGLRARFAGDWTGMRRAEDTQVRAMTKIRTANALANLERSKVMDMTYDQMKAEQTAVGMRYAKSALLTVGTMGLNVAGVLPFGVVSIPTHNDRFKSKLRITDEERSRIYQDVNDSVRNTMMNKTNPPVHTTHVVRLGSENNKSSTLTSDHKPVTSVSKALKSEKPYFAISDQERASIDRSYQDRRAALINKRDNASSTNERQRIVDQLDKLENDYLDIVERD